MYLEVFRLLVNKWGLSALASGRSSVYGSTPSPPESLRSRAEGGSGDELECQFQLLQLMVALSTSCCPQRPRQVENVLATSRPMAAEFPIGRRQVDTLSSHVIISHGQRFIKNQSGCTRWPWQHLR